jgi:hypothetical protein
MVKENLLQEKESNSDVEKELKKIKKKLEIKSGANSFRYILPLISIVGFLGIISETLFYYDATAYVKFFWIMIMGVGLLIEGDAWNLFKSIKKKGLQGDNFTHLVTSTIGLLATITGLLTFPIWNITTPGFLAVKGTISIISVSYIVIQTWIIK